MLTLTVGVVLPLVTAYDNRCRILSIRSVSSDSLSLPIDFLKKIWSLLQSEESAISSLNQDFRLCSGFRCSTIDADLAML